MRSNINGKNSAERGEYKSYQNFSNTTKNPSKDTEVICSIKSSSKNILTGGENFYGRGNPNNNFIQKYDSGSNKVVLTSNNNGRVSNNTKEVTTNNNNFTRNLRLNEEDENFVC